MDDFVLNVRQIGNYPEVTKTGPSDLLLLQINGLGGAYSSISPTDLVGSALAQEGVLQLSTNAKIAWNGATISFASNGFVFSNQITAPLLSAPQILLNGAPVATAQSVTDAANAIINNTVWSFNGRTGDVQLQLEDILQGGGAPVTNAHFNGWITAPTVWNARDISNSVATTAFVQSAICAWFSDTVVIGNIVTSFNGRGGDVILNAADITSALTVPSQYGLTNTPPAGDTSKRIANTAFVDDAVYTMQQQIEADFATIAAQLDQTYAPLNSPQLTGVPTAPTAAQTVNSGQLATTAFVHAAVTASTTGVASFNTRTGAVTLTTADVTSAGGAPLAAPAFTGNATSPTPTPGDNSTRIATTAFVDTAIAAIAAGVMSFNTRTGAVTLTAADVTAVGGALLGSPVFTGTPTAPTAAPAVNNQQLATTAYVTTAIAAIPAPVSSFNGRTGAVTFQGSDISAVNGALLASPAFTGVPTAPTATVGSSNTQIATTAFVQAALGGVVSGVSSFNTRTGAVTLTTADVTGVGGALLASPTFTGVPAAPTATAGTNSTQLATTAFVQAAIAASPGGVTSFNSRTGAIVFQASDVSAVGGALLSSPAFTGNPTAPTPSAGDNDTSIATTAFVQASIATAGGVNSFNGRAGAVVLNSADILNANGAVFAQADTAPTTGPRTFWFDSLHGQLYVNYVDPVSSAQTWAIANPPPPPVPMSFYNYLGGLTLANDATTPNTVIDVATGSAAADDNSMMMVLSSAFTKALGGPWAAGLGSAGLDAGSIAASTWYHVFLIMRPDTGVVDVLISTNPTTPTMPSPYTKKRRIGSIKTDASSHILGFTQLRDQFLWNVQVADVNNVATGTGTWNGTILPSVPLGIKVNAIVSAALNGAPAGQWLALGSYDQVGASPSGFIVAGLTPSATALAATWTGRTGTNQSILAATAAAQASGLTVYTQGWIDNRGK